MKTKVNVEIVRALYAELAKINRLDFKDIEWCEEGQPIDIPDQVREEFHFCGLNNTDFVRWILDASPENGSIMKLEVIKAQKDEPTKGKDE